VHDLGMSGGGDMASSSSGGDDLATDPPGGGGADLGHGSASGSGCGCDVGGAPKDLNKSTPLVALLFLGLLLRRRAIRVRVSQK
jgi:MYXO-CTERM domain-containing protein